MIPAPLQRINRRWQAIPAVDRYRLYTRLVLQVVVVGVVLMLAVSGVNAWSVLGIVIAGTAAVAGLESQPELSIRLSDRHRHIAWRFAVIGLAGTWLIAALIAGIADDGAVRTGAASTAVVSLTMASVAVLPFLRWRWALLAAGVAATAILITSASVLQLVTLAAVGALLMVTTGVTVWSLRVLDELERSKVVAAELQVAQERLRFGRDLHDVVGRGFSAIAVKSELAATLLRAGATDRAAAEIDAVKALAVSSMDDARALARGYRSVDLAAEVAGARSLLSAAGCELTVCGSPASMPAHCHEAAAWVVREGVTNIVRHSHARTAVLELQPTMLTLRNDGAPGSEPAESDPGSSGIDGLRDRLRGVGADLDASRSGSEFTLTATWERS